MYPLIFIRFLLPSINSELLKLIIFNKIIGTHPYAPPIKLVPRVTLDLTECTVPESRYDIMSTPALMIEQRIANLPPHIRNQPCTDKDQACREILLKVSQTTIATSHSLGRWLGVQECDLTAIEQDFRAHPVADRKYEVCGLHVDVSLLYMCVHAWKIIVLYFMLKKVHHMYI